MEWKKFSASQDLSESAVGVGAWGGGWTRHRTGTHFSSLSAQWFYTAFNWFFPLEDNETAIMKFTLHVYISCTFQEFFFSVKEVQLFEV